MSIRKVLIRWLMKDEHVFSNALREYRDAKAAEVKRLAYEANKAVDAAREYADKAQHRASSAERLYANIQEDIKTAVEVSAANKQKAATSLSFCSKAVYDCAGHRQSAKEYAEAAKSWQEKAEESAAEAASRAEGFLLKVQEAVKESQEQLNAQLDDRIEQAMLQIQGWVNEQLDALEDECEEGHKEWPEPKCFDLPFVPHGGVVAKHNETEERPACLNREWPDFVTKEEMALVYGIYQKLQTYPLSWEKSALAVDAVYDALAKWSKDLHYTAVSDKAIPKLKQTPRPAHDLTAEDFQQSFLNCYLSKVYDSNRAKKKRGE